MPTEHERQVFWHHWLVGSSVLTTWPQFQRAWCIARAMSSR